MLGTEIRKSFLDFFESKGHLIVPSASLVPAGDPTLMFTNAGMVQFKDVFLGTTEAPHPRVADSQRCLRISGKHNDLEEVGRDTYHHTFFEMLGNWSFGDYYKAEAIEWAWELLTGVWGLDRTKLYATVFNSDDEAAELWPKLTDIDPARVLRFDEKDNFWEMGDTGPCGPCSEIHIDRGEGSCDMSAVKGHKCAVNAGCARYIELWNLVFIQYSRDESGKLHDLASKHVDTGMGLERIAAVLEGVDGNYDGSLLRTVISSAEGLSGKSYGADPELDVSFRVLADHSRAVSFMIADEIGASNEGRGYVLRRLIRRAARHGKSLGLEGPFFWEVCRSAVASLADAYPELAAAEGRIVDAVRTEEEKFGLTLDRGLVHLDEELSRLADTATVLPGEIAFRLYDTYGFPLDMTEDILRSRGMTVDRPGFDGALNAQRDRAREAQVRKHGAADFTPLLAKAREEGGSRFEGSFETQGQSNVVTISAGGELREEAVEGDDVDIVVSRTPFYGESGGQVGDTGRITRGSDTVLEVWDTQKPAGDVIVHRARIVSGALQVGDEVVLAIDASRREAIRLNHSATHLLHAALRNHLGKGVRQAGSLVEEVRLRFDFTQEGPVSRDLLDHIEREVNEMIRANMEVRDEEMPYDDAIEAGAIAFFGEKYGDVVRVVRMGDYSVELCGGTHVRRTGDIGLLRLYSETGVAAGVRRVEASTGGYALDLVREHDSILRRIGSLLRSPERETIEKVERLLARQVELEKQISDSQKRRSSHLVDDVVAGARSVDGAKVVIARVDGVEAKALRTLSDQVRDKLGTGVVVLAAKVDSGVALTVAVTKDKTDTFNAGSIVKTLAPIVDGRGGGKPDFAQAGGKNADGLDALLEKANEIIV